MHLGGTLGGLGGATTQQNIDQEIREYKKQLVNTHVNKAAPARQVSKFVSKHQSLRRIEEDDEKLIDPQIPKER